MGSSKAHAFPAALLRSMPSYSRSASQGYIPCLVLVTHAGSLARSEVVSDQDARQDIRTSYGTWLTGRKRDAKVGAQLPANSPLAVAWVSPGAISHSAA